MRTIHPDQDGGTSSVTRGEAVPAPTPSTQSSRKRWEDDDLPQTPFIRTSRSNRLAAMRQRQLSRIERN